MFQSYLEDRLKGVFSVKAIVKCVSKINDNYKDIQDSYIKTQNEKIQQLEDTLKIKCQAIVDKDRQYRELEKAYQGQREHKKACNN